MIIYCTSFEQYNKRYQTNQRFRNDNLSVLIYVRISYHINEILNKTKKLKMNLSSYKESHTVTVRNSDESVLAL